MYVFVFYNTNMVQKSSNYIYLLVSNIINFYNNFNFNYLNENERNFT